MIGPHLPKTEITQLFAVRSPQSNRSPSLLPAATTHSSSAATMATPTAATKAEDPPPHATYAETVSQITRIHKSLPPIKPSAEAAKSVETEQNLELEEISKQQEHPPQDVPPELFSVLREIKKAMVSFKSYYQRKEAALLVELDRIFQGFDDLIQKASSLVSGEIEEKGVDGLKDFRHSISSFMTNIIVSSSGEIEVEKLDLLQVAAVIENTFKIRARILYLQGKMLDKVEWLPLSLGKLSTLTTLNIAHNRIMALPNSIGSLKTLMKLDVRANQLINLPSSFGELENLTDLNLSSNLLKSLPDSFKNLNKLIDLDLSSNRFSNLPLTVGNLICLQRLNVETNDLEELPHTIGLCLSLLELRLNFNQLKALPEAIGNLVQLEFLTLHYNRVRRLPSTMGNLSRLTELDVSFNELESIPETLCLDVSLKKINVGENFADLRMLPEALGNLEMLEDLDISDNQIKSLPDSFRFLSNLRNLRADQTPLVVPPRQITKLGARAVVQYMADLVAERDLQTQKKRGFCSYICPLLCFGFGKELK